MSLGMRKVGIALRGSNRLAVHIATGWEPVRVWDGLLGDEARRVERDLIRSWRTEQRLAIGVPSDLMRHGGYTETAPLHLVDITETVLVIDALIDNIKQYAPEE